MSAQNAKLAGKVAWVSGGASGIGEAIAERFASEGAAVMIADLNRELGNSVVKKIQSAGGKAAYTNVDVANSDQVRDSISETVKQFGSVDILINNAGIVHAGMLHEYSEQDWDRLLGVNLKSAFLSFKHAWPHMQKSKRSYIVNIGSISSFTGQEKTPAYCASKGALLQLTRGMALDYGQFGLRCNCLCPGITDTPMLRHHLNTTPDPEGLLRERLSRVPMGVPLVPAHIANAALFLCCDDSFGITGTSLLIDGGYLCTAECHTPPHTAFMD
jgi:NAD(P)-dependent dehydrogenase (short-subunit alcohol dehydrogenase family)